MSNKIRTWWRDTRLWFYGLLYRYHSWRMQREVMRMRREIGKAITPVLEGIIKDIDTR